MEADNSKHNGAAHEMVVGSAAGDENIPTTGGDGGEAAHVAKEGRALAPPRPPPPTSGDARQRGNDGRRVERRQAAAAAWFEGRPSPLGQEVGDAWMKDGPGQSTTVTQSSPPLRAT